MKLIALVLALVVAVSALAGCDWNKKEKASPTPKATEKLVTEAPAVTEEPLYESPAVTDEGEVTTLPETEEGTTSEDPTLTNPPVNSVAP